MLCLYNLQKLLCLTKYFLFQTKFTKLIVSIIPSSLLSKFGESDSDVKLVILDAVPTRSS